MHQLLRSILRNRPLGELVRTLYLEWDDEVDKRIGSPHSLTEAWQPRDTSELEEFYQAALGYGLDPTTFERVKVGSESATASILLFSLPNLIDWDVQPPYAKGLFEDFETHIGGRFLKKVESVRYSHYDPEGAYSVDQLVPFFILPSIHTIVAHMAYGIEGEGMADVEKYYSTSSVEVIRILSSDIDGPTLSMIFRIPRHLKTFIYDRESLAGGLTTRSEFSQAFLNVSGTMEYLSLKWEDFDGDESVFGSFSHLKALKKLEVGFGDLLGTSSSTAMRLVDVLPPNLEELLLEVADSRQWTNSDYVESVRQLLDAKKVSPSTLPNLRKIGMRKEILKPLVSTASQVGVKVGHPVWVGWRRELGYEIEPFVGDI